MKKFISFIVVLFVAVIQIFNVSAKSNDIEISNVELLEKSDEVKANIEDYKDLNINLNTIFFGKTDYVKYKITIKNNTKGIMKIDEVIDNLDSDVIDTEYEYEKKELKKDEEYTFTLTIKCIKDIEEEKIVINNPLSIIIKYDNGKTIDIDVNPNTKDNVINFFIIFILSAISLIVIITKKYKKEFIVLLLLVSLIPISCNAISTKKELRINNNIKVYGKVANFESGILGNKKLKELAGTDTSTSDNAYSVVDTNIKKVLRAQSLPDDFISTEDNTISTEESRAPIYVWFDNGIIYYYSENEKILLNDNSNRLFQNLTALEEIDLSSFDTSNVTSMSAMFRNCTKLKQLDLSNFDTSNVSSMRSMFYNCYNLENIDVSGFETNKVKDMAWMFGIGNTQYNNGARSKLQSLDVSNFNTSNVTNMEGMFQFLELIPELDVSGFDTKNVANMAYIFNGLRNVDVLDVSGFDTSKVTNMSCMFQYCVKLKNIDVSRFDTSKVTNMGWMFNYCQNVENLDVSGFNTSNVANMQTMFQRCEKITSLDLSNFDTSKVTTMGWMFYGCYNLRTIYASENFVTNNVTLSTNMFYGDSNLKGGNGTLYNSGYRDKTYARIDTEETPGYFTLKSA